MPLRSVEAATRDDAIAAAREQFGPQARVVGVRRVRSGGVLGFFATERYVAEVAPDRPPVPVSRGTRDDDLGASPLASAAPATAAPSSVRARGGAPARNGAAAYADVARPAEPARPAESARPATKAAARSLDRTSRPVEPAVDDERVSELAGLLGGVEPKSSPAARAYPRSGGGVQKATFQKAPWTTSADDVDDDVESPFGAPASSSPSPFTAALARMVAGDVHVQQAVEDAVEETRGPTEVARPRFAETAVWPPAARQEEETVGDQVIAPPSMPAAEPLPVEVPTWAAEPEVVAAPDSSREEAIAEVLRSALAQGHSDEALTGILRKVLDGVSPQAALTEPDLPAAPEHVMSDNVVAEPVAAEPVIAEPVIAEPVVVEPVAVAAPVFEPVLAPEPVVVVEPVFTPVVPEPVAVVEPEVAIPPAPATEPFADFAPLPAVDIWGTPTSAPLWGDPVTPARAESTDAPIWAEVLLGEPAEDAVVEETVTDEDPAEAGPVAEEPVAESVDLPEETALEEVLVEEVLVEEVAPVLARTASDPAPFALPTMSLDATSVMPPLSLLPPLPSSRGRGRPPVPPTSRPPVPPSRPASEVAPAAPQVEDETPAAPPAPGPATKSLATVTRLPVAPLMAGPETPELTEQEIALLEEPTVDVPETAEVPAHAGNDGLFDSPVVAAPVARPGDVVGRLTGLGLPARLLGDSFGADVERHGLYAALTRALGLRLPAAPELPTGAGEALFVVGPGVETLRAARSLAASLFLDPDRVQWATRGDLAGLAPASSRMTSVDTAIARRTDAAAASTVTIVAVDIPMRTDAYWLKQMLAIWAPVAVWAVVEATRKPEDVEPWLDGMARVDALIVQDTDLSADPAAVLHRVAAPVAMLDGVRATPHRWASLLCERLEGAEA